MTFFVGTRMACPAPQLDVEVLEGALRVRWDQASPTETAELRVFGLPNAELRDRATLGGAE